MSTDHQAGPAPAVEAAAGEVAQAPAVVAVVVAHEPGPWFEETLRSLGNQTYPAVSVLVVEPTGSDDPGSDDADLASLEARIAAVIPEAHLRRVAGNPGFGAAANECLVAVSGAAFYLFCHDDVALAPDAVQVLVEEAFRSNAGVAGPKVVEWDDPTRLLQVGIGVDKAGAPAPVAEPGELDQEQHDAVRDVFAVPSAAMLVRADLFEAVGGFDEAIDFHGEDVDLCWRAAVAGARVLVVPDAVVRHREELAQRRPDLNARRLRLRHQLRAVQCDYSTFHRIRVVPQLVLLAVAEMIYALALGRFRHLVDVASAWTWNARHRSTRRERRRALAAVRVNPDADIRRVQVRGSARVAEWVTDRLGGDDGLQAMVVGSAHTETVQRGSLRLVLAVWGVVIGGLLIGARELLAGVPAVGTMVRFPSSPGAGFTAWASAYRPSGVGTIGPSSIGVLLASLLSVPFAGSGNLARSVLLVSLLPLGALGAWRLARPIGSRRARLTALVVYVAVPVPANALAGGRFGGLVVYAAAPWVLSHLARASGAAPYGSRGGKAGPGATDRPFVFRCLSLGLLLALVGIAVPSGLALGLIVAVLWTVAALVVGQPRGSLALLGTAVGSTVVAAVLHLPWSLTLLHWSSATSSGPILPPTSAAGRALELGEILRFETGPFGGSPLTWALLPAASLALLLGRSWRLGWAARGWLVALAGWGAVVASSQHWIAVFLPEAEVLLAPAAAGLALAAAMGTAAFEVDLPDYQIGWRQGASVAAAAALFMGVLPPFATLLDGRFGMPDGDFQPTFTNLAADTRAPFRVLWVGDTSVLPMTGFSADIPGLSSPGPGRTLAWATSDGETATTDDLWPGAENGGTRQVTDALAASATGGSRLGQLLAPMGVRFVVVAERLAPGRFANEISVDQPRLREILESQLDLARVEVAGAVVYRNAAWAPGRVVVPGDTAFPGADVSTAERSLPSLAGRPPGLGEALGLVPATGDLPDDVRLYVATPRDDALALTVDGRAAPAQQVFGWSTVFDVADGGRSELQITSRPAIVGAQFGQAAAWLLVVLYLLRVRVDRDERRRARATGQQGRADGSGGPPGPSDPSDPPGVLDAPGSVERAGPVDPSEPSPDSGPGGLDVTTTFAPTRDDVTSGTRR